MEKKKLLAFKPQSISVEDFHIKIFSADRMPSSGWILKI
jgi:hypothetical protein